MRSLTPPALCLAASFLVFFASSLRANVQFSNLGAGDSFNNGIGATISGPQTPGSSEAQAAANEFTAAFTATLTSVDVAIYGVFADQSVTLVFYNNNPLTNLPDTSSMTTLGNVTAVAHTSQLQRLTLSVTVPLVGGINYWLAMLPVAPNAGEALWMLANNTSSNPDAVSHDSGATFKADTTAEAFRINSDVPEPSTWASLGVCLLGMGVALRRRLRAQLTVQGRHV